MTVARWEQPTMLSASVSRDVIDGWATQVASIAKLADYIAPTDFVPRAYRNQPAAIAAAILAGREMGIGPMTALQHLHVVDGRPAMSAQLMRALVMAAGHTLRIVESSNGRCVITGHRKGETTDRAPVTFSTEDARQAGLLGRGNWKTYPRAMCLARATGEICRRDYADVILGMAYTVEEAQDMDGALDAAPTGGTRRTVQRSPKRLPAPTAEDSNTPAEDDAQDHQADTPLPSQPGGPPAPPLPEDAPQTVPLPPEHTQDDSAPAPTGPGHPEAPGAGGRKEAPQSSAEDQGAPPHQDEADSAPQAWESASGKQLAHLFALLGELGQMTPRERRLTVVSALVGRRLQSMNQLTRGEATPLIDTLVRISQGGHPQEEIDWLVQEGMTRLAEIDARDDPNQDALWPDDPDQMEGETP